MIRQPRSYMVLNKRVEASPEIPNASHSLLLSPAASTNRRSLMPARAPVRGAAVATALQLGAAARGQHRRRLMA